MNLSGNVKILGNSLFVIKMSVLGATTKDFQSLNLCTAFALKII